MKPLTELRLKAVGKFAALLQIPVTIHEDMLPEVMLERIDRYIDESVLLLVECWQKPERREEFTKWVTELLVENMHNPFSLHDHPLQMGMYFLGLTHADPESHMVQERFTKFAKTPAYADRFRQGWRCSFGTEK